MDSNVRVSDLLRRVKFTATQLGLGKVEDWVDQELNGYDGQPPDSRVLHGRPMCFHPYRGWQELGGAFDWMRRRANNQPVSSFEGLIGAKPDVNLHMAFPHELAAKLNESNGTAGWNFDLVIPASEAVRVLDQVRNLVLDWALNLQKAGIMGTEISFNKDEKDKAQAASTTIHIGSIGNFAGSIGQGNVAGNNSVQTADIQSVLAQLKPHLQALADAGADEMVLSERIAAIEIAINKNSPDVSQVRGLLTDLRNTLTGAAGNIIATGAIAALNIILGTGVPAT
jgi:hypothetical protein